MLRRTTPIVRWIVVFLLLSIAYFYHSRFGFLLHPSIDLLPSNLAELEYVKLLLKKHNVGPMIEYASRSIHYTSDVEDRKSITKVSEALFPQSFSRISIADQKILPTSKPLNVQVKRSPRPDETNASGLLFGVSTTFDRFHDSRTSPVSEWSRWLTNGQGVSNGAGLILALLNSSASDIDFAAKQLADAGINATVLPSDPTLDMPGRYVNLVNMLYNHPTRDKRSWFALIDDDTFFPYIHQLQNTLSNYDEKIPYYIGTFTERIDWMLYNHAPFAYGGGGVFLSLPTVKKLVQSDCLAKNSDGTYLLHADQGDRLLYNCIHQNSEITLTHLPLLHQLDQFGDPSGFYESGQQPLSLHHYKSWHQFSPHPTHTIADACGEDCVFQRFQFADEYILSNGYSLAHYPNGIDFDVDHIEHTFDAGEKNNPDLEETVFSYAFGQMRPGLSRTGRKKAWHLLDARREGPGIVKQVYLKRRSDDRWYKEGEAAPDLDSIVVLNWIP
ncbi:glycosyltransferase Family 31 [Blumeria hordei DH14]|uniref:Glycosyltransferase Family 31 n=1 Tax=Blumeria graminis f. sp. hordei (strain DH14) TaxID=546991 RepID=N1J4T5_BLUG1|nr:glycosyltransferase Family 31 [Blumeria hordei DH14]